MNSRSLALLGAVLLSGPPGCTRVGANDEQYWDPSQGISVEDGGASGSAGDTGSGGDSAGQGGTGIAGTGSAGLGGSSGMAGSAGFGGAGTGGGAAGVGGVGGLGGFGGAGSGGAGSGGGGSAGMAGMGGGGGTGGKGECQLLVSITTKSYGGRFSPRNIGAIWVEDAQGAFVKTLQIWAARRVQYLVNWNDASNSNQVDAISSATSPSHMQRNPTWNCRDADQNVVPDGIYRIRAEYTEDDAEGESTQIEFTKSLTPEKKTFPDAPYFINMSTDFQ